MPITWNRKTPCESLGITYLPTGERQISWPINSPISRSDPLHVRLWERDTLIRVWIFVLLATLEDINWGRFLIWFSHVFRPGGLTKRSYHFQNSLPLELRNTKHPFRHPLKKGEQDFLWCFGTQVPWVPGVLRIHNCGAKQNIEAKQAEERKRDEDWANCVPPIEDMWAMKKGS